MRQYVFLDECGVTTDLLRRYGPQSRAARASAITLTTAAAPSANLSLFVASASSVCLAALGALAARAGGAPLLTGALRVAIWGAFAMAVTAGVGWILWRRGLTQR